MKSGHCLMTEKLPNDHEYYRSILFFFSNETVFNFIQKFELNKSHTKTYYSTYSFQYDSFIDRFTKILLDLSKLSISVQKNILNSKFEEIMLYLIDFKVVDFIFFFN